MAKKRRYNKNLPQEKTNHKANIYQKAKGHGEQRVFKNSQPQKKKREPKQM